MKLNITTKRNQEPVKGYQTVDFDADIDQIAEDSQCEEILALNVIDYISVANLDATVQLWVKKLRHGGIIKISGTDLFLVAKAIDNKSMDISTANLHLYGSQETEDDFKLCCLEAGQIKLTLQSLGLKVVKIRYNDPNYLIEAERP